MATSSDEGQTIRINGFEMYFEIIGEGSPLLLLHGGTGIGANWQLIFPSPPPGFKLIVPDLRGHGRSTNPAQNITFRQSALDVLALMDHLALEQFSAIGLSFGAKTLLHAATQQPNRIESMILVSATPYFPKQARDIMAAMAPESHSGAEWEQMRKWHKHGDEQIRALWKWGHELKDSYDDMNFTPAYLSTISARTLIVHGDRDPLYPVKLALEMYSAIPRSYLWVVPNGGHGPIFGDTTEEFVKMALRFFGDQWRS
ncbi:MAG TPA: alpha/beta hydrolase [Blastocatellia bacterium]|nr:alpha/beta hydrolase [Blastocatellia bacterium]